MAPGFAVGPYAITSSAAAFAPASNFNLYTGSAKFFLLGRGQLGAAAREPAAPGSGSGVDLGLAAAHLIIV